MAKTSKDESVVNDNDVSKAKKSRPRRQKSANDPQADIQPTGGKDSLNDHTEDNPTENKAAILNEEDSVDTSDDLDDSCNLINNEKTPENDPVCELAAEKDKYLRLLAEYDNFRKRSAKEKSLAYTEARASTITAMLPVYDNLERALKMPCSDEAFFKGVDMTMAGLMEIFENLGVTVIESVGKAFDPNLHNAVMSIEDPDLGEKEISEEFQKGFMLGDKVIRFSTVVVAN